MQPYTTFEDAMRDAMGGKPPPAPPAPQPQAAASAGAKSATAGAKPGLFTRIENWDVGKAASNAATKGGGLLRSTLNAASNIAKSPTAIVGSAITGAVQSINDLGNGYRDHFIDSVGADSPLKAVAADAARTFGNIGNVLSFGVAERVGRGLSNAYAGQSFMDGFMEDRDRVKFLERGAKSPLQSQVDQRVSNVLAKNPALRGTPSPEAGSVGSTLSDLARTQVIPTSTADVSKLSGGPLKSPMLTDNPLRAVADYQGKAGGMDLKALENTNVVQSTANSDRAFLQGAFQRYVNSGDLEGARRTAVSPDDFAALGIAEKQFMENRAKEAQLSPLLRLQQELVEKLAKPEMQMGRQTLRRGEVAPDNKGAALAALGQLVPMIQAAQGSGQRVDPLSVVASQAAGRGQTRAAEVDTALKEQTLQGGQQMNALRAALAREKDPATRAQLTETLLAAQGKTTKDAPSRALKLTVPYGEPNQLGVQATRDVIYDPDTGKFIDPMSQIKPATPSREKNVADAKRALAAGASKQAINERSMQLYGYEVL